MRFVNKDLNDIPDVFKKPNVIEDFEKIALTGDKALIKDTIYKDTYEKNGKSESRVRDKLNIYYHGKCAYCEMHCKAEIEHYRPKKGVDEDRTHNGYYWLCYEWSNLVPSCRYCNTEGGKGNKFPVKGPRQPTPPLLSSGKPNMAKYKASVDPLILEQAHLLHPEIDDPKLFFGFEQDPEKKGIKISGIDSQDRGKETIRICNLNRDYAKLNRMEAVLYPFIVEIDRVFEYITNGLMDAANIGKALKLCFEQVFKSSSSDILTHTLLRWFVVKDEPAFLLIVAPLIQNDNQREIVAEAFRNYKSGSL